MEYKIKIDFHRRLNVYILYGGYFLCVCVFLPLSRGTEKIVLNYGKTATDFKRKINSVAALERTTKNNNKKKT